MPFIIIPCNIKKWKKILTMEKAEYAKSDAPKLTPSNTNAKEFRG